MKKHTFAIAINCMDGRTQEPLIKYIKQKFGVDYVDMVTEPGPDKLLAQNKEKFLVSSIKRRVQISIEKHQSSQIVIAGHADCAGNPVSEEDHQRQIKQSVETIYSWGWMVPVLGVWIDQDFHIEEVVMSDQNKLDSDIVLT